MTALVLTASPLSLAHTTSVLPDAPEIESPLEVLTSAEEQKRIRVLVNDSLADMLEAVDHLSRSTGSLLNLSTPEAKAGELLSTSQQVVDVALRMSEDAMLLAKEADELANLESVPEAERQLAYQIYEAAKLVSSIAHDLAMSERSSLAGMQDATQSS